MKLKVKQIVDAISDAKVAGNHLLLDSTVSIALTDSRSLSSPADTVFFALRTDTGDGHNYIESLYNRGVRVFVASPDRVPTLFPDALWILTERTLEALQAVGRSIRSMHSEVPVIAITGSRGKTVVKEMLNSMLVPEVPMAVSPRSWNSQIGVPLAMWEFDTVLPSRLGVFEAGISHCGEMESLRDILNPTLGIFTGLTDEHSRGFASEREKCSEKCQLFSDVSAVFSLPCPVFEEIFADMYPGKRLVVCPTLRELCLAVAAELKLLTAEAEVRLETLMPVSSRLDITETADGSVIAFDYFTNDLSAVRTALDDIRRRISSDMHIVAVLGDLLCVEGGEEEYYDALWHTLMEFGVKRLIAAGPVISHQAKLSSCPVKAVGCADGLGRLMDLVSMLNHYNSAVYFNGTPKSDFHQAYAQLGSRRNVTQLEINLDSIAANLRHYRSLVPSETGLVGMVKASAYGCGSLEVARTLQDAGADMIAVAVVDEGVELRLGGVTVPVIVLDPWCENLRAIFAHNLQPTLIDANEPLIAQLEDAATAEGVDTINVHVKLDTGMHRVGLSESEIPAFVEMLKHHPRVRVATTFSHLATADCLDLDDYTEGQLALFERMSSLLSSLLGYPVKRHVLNTAGITRYGRSHVYELARVGIGLYGISPLDEADRRNLNTVARLRSRVIAVRSYPAGTSVGYGCKGHLDRPSVIGTVPIGYADGIDRRLGNGHACFLINGKECPTVGNICMDLCMVDVTDCPDAYNAEVEVFGPNMPIERLSDTLGTIPYEVLARISPRVKRVYYRE